MRRNGLEMPQVHRSYDCLIKPLSFLPPVYVARREGNVFSLFVCSQGRIPLDPGFWSCTGVLLVLSLDLSRGVRPGQEQRYPHTEQGVPPSRLHRGTPFAVTQEDFLVFNISSCH